MVERKTVDVNEAYHDLKTVKNTINRLLQQTKTPTTNVTPEVKGKRKLRNSLIAAGIIFGTIIGGTAITKHANVGICKQEVIKSYFEQNKYKRSHISTSDESRKYFSSSMDFLKSCKLKPEIISDFNMRAKNMEKKEGIGLYLSAMMQTSYNQGFNDFTFEEVNANFFGAYMKGQPENLIKITAKNIEGNWSLSFAENCSLTAGIIEGYNSLIGAKDCSLTAEILKGNSSLALAENCSLETKTLEGNNSLVLAKYCPLTAETIKGNNSLDSANACSLTAGTLEGDYSLRHATTCFVEIQNYNGTNFGTGMSYSTIKSPNRRTLWNLKWQTEHKRSNTFERKR